jgi:hypothetical protein
VHAESVTGLFNTGVDASGTPLPDGTIGDPHYALVSVPGGTTDIRVRRASGGFPIPPWLGDDAVSAWIGPNNDASVDGPVGAYDYRTTFTAAFGGTLTLTGRWSTDNEGIGISLNGGPPTNPITDPLSFESWHPFTVTGVVTAGVNTLDFLVHNDGGPTGVRVEFFQATVVPAPPGVLLASVGAACLAGFCLLRRPGTPAI